MEVKGIKSAEEFNAFCKRNGFIWGPEPELYGGIAGFYTYGPLGKLLKNHVENRIRKVFTDNGFWEIEAPIVMPEVVWKASGHLDNFVDPLIRCSKCDSSFRADNIIEENHDVVADAMTKKQLLEFIKKHKIVCPKCKGRFTDKIEDFNLMMKTKIGTDIVAFNRPETATTTYLPFKNYYEYFRRKMPISVFQIGKAFRNEISPRQGVIRGREFTQAEAQLIVMPQDKKDFAAYSDVKKDKIPFWPAEYQEKGKKPVVKPIDYAVKNSWLKNKAYAWSLAIAYRFISSLNIPVERVRLRQHTKKELAFYADDAWDIELKFNNYGWIELVGIHDRQDYDLKQHDKFSKKGLKVEGVYPHILELAFGSDRPTFALLDLFLETEKTKDGNRFVLKLPRDIVPIQVAVFPLMKKDELKAKARKICNVLKENYACQYDEAGSIGKRYRRMDEVGTPYCITVDYDTLEDDSVTVRDRDTMKQKRVKIKDLHKSLVF
jgi:glycyl-tRNA synthetase